MYKTDDLYDQAAANLGVTAEALDRALGDVTLVAGDSWLVEVTAEGEFAVMVPRDISGEAEVPQKFVALTAAMLRMENDPAFLEELMQWAEENSGD